MPSRTPKPSRTFKPSRKQPPPASQPANHHAPPSTPPSIPPRTAHTPTVLPHLMTADEVADLLRTSRKAVYAAISRDQLPGVVRLRRRVLFNRGELISWLAKQQSLSLEGHQR